MNRLLAQNNRARFIKSLNLWILDRRLFWFFWVPYNDEIYRSFPEAQAAFILEEAVK